MPPREQLDIHLPWLAGLRRAIRRMSPIAIPYLLLGGFIAVAALYDILLNAALWLS